MTDSVVLLEPGDERAKKIGKAMASQTANDILSLLKTGNLTLTEIADSMNQPMTTLKYHVENLLDAGLIEVKKIKYSEKGREVKVYGVCEQVVIVSAGNKDIRQILMKYASVFGIFILATFALGIISSSMFSAANFYDAKESMSSADIFTSADYDAQEMQYSPSAVNNASATAAAGDERVVYTLATPAPLMKSSEINESTGAGSAGAIAPADAFANKIDDGREGAMHFVVFSFFTGGCAVLIVLMIYEAFLWRREKKYWSGIKNKENN